MADGYLFPAFQMSCIFTGMHDLKTFTKQKIPSNICSNHNNKSLILTIDELPVNIRENVNTIGTPQRIQTSMNNNAGMPLCSIKNQLLINLITEYVGTVIMKKQIAPKSRIGLFTLYDRLSENHQRS